MEHAVEPLEPDRHDRNLQAGGEHADTGLERADLARVRPAPLGKDQYRGARAQQLAEMADGFAGAGLALGQREHVEEQAGQVVVEAVREPPPQRVSADAEVRREEFLAGRGRHPVAPARRQRRQDDRRVQVALVVGRVDDRPRRRVQMVPALDGEPGEHPRQRQQPQSQVDPPGQPCGPARGPGGKVERRRGRGGRPRGGGARKGRPGDERAQVPDGGRGGERGLVDGAVERLLERHEQLDAFDGAEAQLGQARRVGDLAIGCEALHDGGRRGAAAGRGGGPAAAPAALDPALQLAPLQLARALGARQGPVRPDRPAPDLLVVLQAQVGLPQHRGRLGAGFQHQHRVHVLAAVLRDADHAGLPHAGHGAQHLLDVLRKHVQPLRGDDHLLLAAPDGQVPGRVPGADVPGPEPAVVEGRGGLARGVVVAGRHVVTAHQDLAVRAELHVDAPDRPADRAPPRAERMVEGHDGRRLRQPVALDDEKAQPRPERLELGIEGRGADHEGPELEAEQPVDAPVAPPAAGHVGRRMLPGGFRGEAQHMVAQHLQYPGHADHDRHAPPADLTHDVGRVVAAHEDRYPRQQRRDEGGHGLAEHVAERQQVEEPQRGERAGVAAVPEHLVLDGDHVREDVAVRQPHPLGVGGGARREDDLGQLVGRAAVPAHVRLAAVLPARRDEPPQRPDLDAVPAHRGLQALADQHGARVDNRRDARHELPGGAKVHRHEHGPREQAAPHRRDPVRAVLAPDHDPVARSDVRARQAAGEGERGAADLVVRVPVRAVAVVVDDEVRRGPDTVVEKIEQRIPPHESIMVESGRPAAAPSRYLNDAPTLSTMSVRRGDAGAAAVGCSGPRE